jgi:hypothetical protein
MGSTISEKQRKAKGSHRDLLFFFFAVVLACALMEKPNQTPCPFGAPPGMKNYLVLCNSQIFYVSFRRSEATEKS